MGPVCQADRGITNMTVLQNHFLQKKERFQLLIRVFDIAPYNMEGALLPEYESGSLYGMGGSQFRTKWLSANGILSY